MSTNHPFSPSSFISTTAEEWQVKVVNAFRIVGEEVVSINTKIGELDVKLDKILKLCTSGCAVCRYMQKHNYTGNCEECGSLVQ